MTPEPALSDPPGVRNCHLEDVVRPAVSIALLLAIVVPGTATAVVIHVPGDVAHIDTALSLADPGDTVLVAPGTYETNLEWPDKPGIRLVSEFGPGMTVLDGRGKAQVIGFYHDADTTTVVSGFTIRNGYAAGQ
jgi:hypothetical protein